MGLATTLQSFLDGHNLGYETVAHEFSESSQRTAAAAHLSGHKLAKAILLKDDGDFLLAVLPAARRLHLGHLHHSLQRPVGLATEDEVATLFADCRTGAVPPAGLLYGIDTVVDDSLLEEPDVYFEAGDHEQLIHMNQRDFRRLLGDATHAQLSHPATG